MPECRWATRNLSGQEEGFVELGHLDKYFIKKTIWAFLSTIRKIFFCLVTCLWVWLNMYQYPWIWLNVFANGWTNCSDYSRALNMHAYLICLTGFEDVSISESRFLNWHGCIYKIYPEFWICLIIAPYVSITTVYTQICVNVPEYSWI